jgi:hypothetical protein
MRSQARTPRRPDRHSAWLRLFLAGAFAILLSDLPMFVSELYSSERDCCAGPCEGADDQGHCPPNCTYGACSKTLSAPLQVASLAPSVATHSRTVVLIERSGPRQGFHGDVFHPPRS